MDKPREFYILESSIVLGDDVNASSINANRSSKMLPGPYRTFIEKSAYDKLQASNKALSEEISRHIYYLEHQCRRYLEVDKEKIAVVKILPPIKMIIEALKTHGHKDKEAINDKENT